MTVGSTSVANPLLTVICVYADYHQHLIERASASVDAQTIPACFVALPDRSGSPAGGRNEGAQNATTPFITFLDADDTLAPTFAERMILAYQRGRYVYCDYMQDGVIHRMPDRHDCSGYKIHHPTCLWSRDVFLQTGGFKTGILMEDTEFYLRVMRYGVCGVRCPSALLNYASDGKRSAQARQSPRYHAILNDYYRSNPIMGCCGKDDVPEPKPDNAQLPGDVLVQSLWGGMMQVVGQQTGRRYRSGNGRTLWVDPRDARAQPKQFRVMEHAPIINDTVDFDALKADVLTLIRQGA